MIELKGYVHDRTTHFLRGENKPKGATGKILGNIPRVAQASKRRKRIKRVSKKKREQDKIYAKLRPQFLAEHPACEIQWDDKCSKKATQVHHVQRRGKFYLKTETWKSSCRHCHAMVEAHGEEAEKLGHLIRVRNENAS